MDTVLQETLLAGMSDAEIAEIVGREFGRRGKTGMLYMLDESSPDVPEIGFVLSLVDGDFSRLPFHKQLAVLSTHAAQTDTEVEKNVIVQKAQ